MLRQRSLLRRVFTLFGRKLDVTWVCSRRHYARETENVYLELEELGIRDHADLSKCAQLVQPSSFRRNVLIVQPIFKNIPANTMKTTYELQKQEAEALVSTMQGRLNVCDSVCLSTRSERKKLFFGKGNFRELFRLVEKYERKLGNLTVFLNVNMLNPLQQFSLHSALGVDVYDRYMLVLQIFKYHARTKEAKLQTSLAEIPYFRSRMSFHGTDAMLVQLGQRELKLKSALEDLKGHRALLRRNRQKLELPGVAVVGYTNAGKTSLIKKLTDSDTLTPRNQLFATLDVTCHEARLPKLGKVLYVDTVGFISDIPTQLIASFQATLEDALLSDCIVHVYDLSHPDLENQCEIVMQTLKEIETPQRLMDNIIHVGNKVDLLSNPDVAITKAERILGSCIPISSVTAQGIRDALIVIEETLVKTTQRGVVQVRCRTGSSEYMQLYRTSDAVLSMTPDEEDQNFSVMKLTLTPTNLQKLRARFRDNSSVEFL